MGHAPGGTRVAELTAELETRILRRLALEWDHLDWYLFRSKMRRPQLRLLDGRSRLGEWSSKDRTIAIARHALLELPWIAVLEILKHEMAHQFVDEILGGEPLPHGPAFVRVCRERGIDPSASGTPHAPDTPQAEDRVIARVRKLLALAESSNQHEAELAASTAQRLILKFNLDLERRAPDDEGRFHFAWLGTPSTRVQAHQRQLSALLMEHFFVECVWVHTYLPERDKSATVLEVAGRPENVQMAEFVHDFMLRTIERLWIEHKRALGLRSDRDRRAFLTGAIEGFGTKLDDERRKAQREGLVWVGDAAVDDYVHRRHPRLRCARSSAQERGEAYQHGRSAGRSIVLSRPMTSTSDESAPRRALPRGRD